MLRLTGDTVMMSYFDCCSIIVRHQSEPGLRYAVEYAKAGRYLKGHPAKVQALYILNNMTHWRGDTAKAVRQSLQKFSRGA
jgi:hypothetical protein